MGLKSMLICDNGGLPFYSRNFDEFIQIDDALLSGLLSAIGTIGKTLFKQEIATIKFGEGNEISRILVITRELFSSHRQIFFVFFYTGEIDIKRLRSVSTLIFMEAKRAFKDQTPETKVVGILIDKILDNKFDGLKDM
ncbi:MAG: hypothetical protein ACTSRK_11960 [Promethearchaeota archaeon]